MNTIVLFGRHQTSAPATRPADLASASRLSSTSHPTLRLNSDTISIRFAGANTLKTEAMAFSRDWGEKLNEPAVQANQAYWAIMTEKPGVTVEDFRVLKEQALLAGLDNKADETLTRLLKEMSKLKPSQRPVASVQAHLQILKSKGFIQPKTEKTIRLAKTQAALEARRLDLYMQRRTLLEAHALPPYHAPNYWEALQSVWEMDEAFGKALSAELEQKEQALQADYDQWAREKEKGVPDYSDWIFRRQGLTKEQARQEQTKAEEKAFGGSNIDLHQYSAMLERENHNLEILGLPGLESLPIDFEQTKQATRKMAAMIGQSSHLEHVLAKADLREDFGQERGQFYTVNAPDDVRIITNWRMLFPDDPGLFQINQLKRFLRTAVGYGIGNSLIDRTLPPQLRNQDYADNAITVEGLAFQVGQQVYRPKFLVDALGLHPEHVQMMEKRMLEQKEDDLLFSLNGSSYGAPPLTRLQIKMYYADMKLGLYAIAWGAQLEAAMEAKYKDQGGFLSKAAWDEIEAVLGKGNMLNWKEQIKILSSPHEKIQEVLPLVGTPEGKKAIQALPGPDFNFNALFAEIKRLQAGYRRD